MIRFALLVMCLIASTASAIETESLVLRHGSESDDLVTLTRDAAGNLLLRDEATTPVTLNDLAHRATSHATLSGLAKDDHPQYLNTSRHNAVHAAPYNNALAIGPDAAGNGTMGAHVADSAIHLNRNTEETLEGEWTFTESVAAAAGAIAMGPSDYSSNPALRFSDEENDAEIIFDGSANEFSISKPISLEHLSVSGVLDGSVGASPSAALSGFSSIVGIAAGDLLSSTANESVAQPWTFLSDVAIEGTLEVERISLPGLPAFTLRALNYDDISIQAGDAVAFVIMENGIVGVNKITGSISTTTPFAGIAMDAATGWEEFDVAIFGAVRVKTTSNFNPGDPVTWNGSNAVSGTNAFGYALESIPENGTLLIWLGDTRY